MENYLAMTTFRKKFLKLISKINIFIKLSKKFLHALKIRLTYKSY